MLRSTRALSTAAAAVKKVVITGPPGGGKGTMSSRLVRDFDLTHLSSGDMLRNQIAEGTALGTKAKIFMEAGDLVPDALLVDIILSSLESTQGSWLLDGFPRTVEQARILDGEHDIDVVLQVDVPHDEIIERLANRWVHAASPPKVAGKDDETGEDLIQRPDDKAETVLNRLQRFDEMMQPIIDHYTAKDVLHTFTGRESDVIYPQMADHLKSMGW